MRGMGSIRPQIFNKDNLVYWKTRTRAYLQSLGADVWEIGERGYQYPTIVPMNPTEKKSYETKAKVWEFYQNQNSSKSCSSTQPKKYGIKSFRATKETPR